MIERETKRERERGRRERMGNDKFEDQVETIAISNWLSNTRQGLVSTIIVEGWNISFIWKKLDNKTEFQVIYICIYVYVAMLMIILFSISFFLKWWSVTWYKEIIVIILLLLL